MKILSVFYWIVAVLFGALSLFSNSWTGALSPGGTPSTDYLLQLVVIIVLVIAAIESWKTRTSRSMLQIQKVLGPVYLVVIGILIYFAFHLMK